MKKLIFLLSTLAFFTACSCEDADASTFYQWTNKDGSVSATDNAARIPSRYKGIAVQRDFSDLENSARQSYAEPSYASVTESSATEADQVRITVTDPQVPMASCPGPVNVIKERRQVGAYNRTFYTVINECGNVVYDSTIPVRTQLNR